MLYTLPNLLGVCERPEIDLSAECIVAVFKPSRFMAIYLFIRRAQQTRARTLYRHEYNLLVYYKILVLQEWFISDVNIRRAQNMNYEKQNFSVFPEMLAHNDDSSILNAINAYIYAQR